MTFTPEEAEALEALSKIFVVPDITLADVREHYNYHEWARNGIEGALTYYAYAKLKDSTDWEEIQRRKNEEFARKLAERSEEVRLGTMTGILSGLLPKISKAIPEGARVLFDITEEEISLTVLHENQPILSVEYYKGSLDLSTSVDGHHYLEDTTYLNGNTSPRQQLEGINAIHVYLESLTN